MFDALAANVDARLRSLSPPYQAPLDADGQPRPCVGAKMFFGVTKSPARRAITQTLWRGVIALPRGDNHILGMHQPVLAALLGDLMSGGPLSVRAAGSLANTDDNNVVQNIGYFIAQDTPEMRRQTRNFYVRVRLATQLIAV